MPDRFRTRGYVPEGFPLGSGDQALDFGALPPFLRTLLVTDGTVTKSLEAYFWESVQVENLGQSLERLTHDVEWLEVVAGDEVLRRRVRLVGETSGRIYTYAESLLRLGQLPPGLQEPIRQGRIGIGELLRECGLETYRELLDFGVEAVGEQAATFNHREATGLVFRVYRISLGHHPAILITEKFPLSLYRAAGQQPRD
jgi:chorismate-pyruvate lyase